MALWATLHPDYDHPQVPPPAEVRSAESLGVPKWPEIDRQNPVFFLRKKVSSNVGKIIHLADKGVVTKATSEKTGEIRIEQEKKEFLAKLYPKLKSDNTALKRAIEDRTIQLSDVPGKNLYAISLNGKNLDYLYEKSGREYFDLTYSRWDKLRYYVFQDALKDFWLSEKLENWEYQLSRSNKRIPTFSPEYFSSMLKVVDFLLWFSKTLRQIADELEKEGK